MFNPFSFSQLSLLYVRIYTVFTEYVFVQIVITLLIGDKFELPLQSERPYNDLFTDTWKAFTDHPVIPLRNYDNKTVFQHSKTLEIKHCNIGNYL